MHTTHKQTLKQQADQLYEQYAKPLVKKHRGKYVAIAPNGETVIAPSLNEVMDQSFKTLGPGSFIFLLGEKAIYQWQ